MYYLAIKKLHKKESFLVPSSSNMKKGVKKKGWIRPTQQQQQPAFFSLFLRIHPFRTCLLSTIIRIPIPLNSTTPRSTIPTLLNFTFQKININRRSLQHSSSPRSVRRTGRIGVYKRINRHRRYTAWCIINRRVDDRFLFILTYGN